VGDSRGTLFRVRFGFARGVRSPVLLLLLLLAAAALFLRGFAIILRVRREERERERETEEEEEEEGEVGGQLWWPLEVAVLKRCGDDGWGEKTALGSGLVTGRQN